MDQINTQHENLYKVLLIEDNPADIDLIIKNLKSLPDIEFIIQNTQTIKDATTWLEAGDFDIIVLDLNLHDSFGVETVIRVRDINKSTPIIVVTEIVDKEIALEALNKGAQDVLIKEAYTSRYLLKSIQYAIEKKRNETEIEKKQKYEKERLAEFESAMKTLSNGDFLSSIPTHDKNDIFDKLANNLLNLSHDLERTKNSLDESLIEKEKLYTAIDEFNEDLKNIVYISSHDLKEPLVNIGIFSSQMINDIKVIAKKLDSIDSFDEFKNIRDQLEFEILKDSELYISSSVKRLYSQIDGLLQISKLASHELNKKEIDVKALVEEVIKSLKFEIEEKNAEILWSDLNPCTGDRTLLQTIFHNLILNAVRYKSPERGCKVEISSKSENGNIIYEIKDNGLGIHKNEQEKIFRFFYKSEKDLDSKTAGIGLSLVRWACKKLSGKIWVESEVNQGSSLFVSLPK